MNGRTDREPDKGSTCSVKKASARNDWYLIWAFIKECKLNWSFFAFNQNGYHEWNHDLCIWEFFLHFKMVYDLKLFVKALLIMNGILNDSWKYVKNT